MVVANELLDNLPFRLLVFDGGWREAHVDVGRDGLVEVLAPLDGALPHVAAADALRTAPVCRGSRRPPTGWPRRATSCWRGTVLAFDYVTARTAQLAIEPWRQWLRTYRGHERGGHYLVEPGCRTSPRRWRSTSCRRPTRCAPRRSSCSCGASTSSSTRAGELGGGAPRRPRWPR